eukprot:jgi/Mesen1/3878/ME000208S02887
MSTAKASWSEVTYAKGAPSARSSHAVAVIGRKAYVFGGELEPRVPLDNHVHVFDLDARAWSIAAATGNIPLPRVGVAMAVLGRTIYVFGGRDADHSELNQLYSFNTDSSAWMLLAEQDAAPPHRSYHTLVADETRQQVYTFGGCGKDGRLNDLWAYDTVSAKWKQLSTPPPGSSCVPRGGPGLAVVCNSVWVLFGFNGSELGDVQRFDLTTHTWEEVELSGEAKPSARSVFGTAAVEKYIVLYGGEVDPSDQGHMGAGMFSGEVWLLDTEKRVWLKPDIVTKDGHDPGARGWFAAAPFNNSILVYGGNSQSNDRLDDMYTLTIDI